MKIFFDILISPNWANELKLHLSRDIFALGDGEWSEVLSWQPDGPHGQSFTFSETIMSNGTRYGEEAGEIHSERMYEFPVSEVSDEIFMKLLKRYLKRKFQKPEMVFEKRSFKIWPSPLRRPKRSK